ncbi:MAG: GNAT family N-acetyltransferase [Vitreimonas sp.]
MTHPLDRPVWSALTTLQRSISEGGELARRYRRDVNVFAAALDESEAALRALGELVRPGESVISLQGPEIVAPPGMVIERAELGVQMWRRTAPQESGADDVAMLCVSDAAEMCALAAQTNPGPFLMGTVTMGRFIGVRRDGRLAAMAGERMAMEGLVEVSGVCVDPAFRGQGLAARLSALVAGDIQRRGQTPFLHAWKSNAAAIALYRKLGFDLRREVHVAVLRKD